MMRNIALVLLVCWSVSLAGVIDQLGKDPEQSWLALIDLIKRDPDSQYIFSEGPRISAKRRLVRFESLIRRAVTDEDFDLFVKELSNSLDLQVDLSKEAMIVFPQLQGHIKQFEKGEFSEAAVIKSFWKLGITTVVPKGFGKWLVESFLKDPLLLDWNLVGLIKTAKNREDISREIIDTCLMYKDNEPSFPSLYRLFEIANEYDKDYSKEFGDELKSYVDLLNAINKLEPSRVTSSELSKIISQFDQLSLPKEEIKKRIAFLIENAKKVGIRFDQVESKDKYIDNLLKEPHALVVKGSYLTWIILGVIACAIILSIDRIRLNLLIWLGMKKAAIKTCRRILLREPSDLKTRSRLAMLYEQLGDINQAVKEYQCIKDLSKMLRSPRENRD